jgi:rhodanese-related sulfurtransferase
MSTAKVSRRSARAQRAESKRPPVWLWAGLAVLMLAVLGALYWQSRPQPVGLPAEISVAEAAAKREAGAFVLDVRTPEEWADFHAPGSTLIPLDQLAARVNEVPRDQEVVVVCRSGNRSQQGRDILLNAGFTQVTSMAGGLNEWRAAGYPVESGP